MVFGLWTFNKQSPCLRMKDSIIKLLISCRDQGLDQYLPDIIVEAYRITGLPKKTLAEYFKNLNYEFTATHQAGLSHYEAKLREFDLIKELTCK
jgi:predicted solute-binding protein